MVVADGRQKPVREYRGPGMLSKFIKSGALKTTAIATAGFLALSATLIQADNAEIHPWEFGGRR